ncbi:MAG: hypothetical protein AAB673_02735 [Patescibacteria group bacterium]
MVIKYLNRQLPPLRVLAQQRNYGRSVLQTRLQRSLKIYVQKNQERWKRALPRSGDLIAVADAIWYRVAGQKHTIYIILLRPVQSSRAVICPPLILPGHEDYLSWQQAFDNLPLNFKTRILALICDGGTGLILTARFHGWIIQRCHFHLLSAVQNYLTTGPRSAQRAYALHVLQTAQRLLKTNKPKELLSILTELTEIRRRSTSRGLRRVLGGLLQNYPDYHNYLKHPQLNLPTTSNSAESFIQCIRDLMYRGRGFRSLTTLKCWLTAVSIFKKTIQCNGKKPTKLTN